VIDLTIILGQILRYFVNPPIIIYILVDELSVCVYVYSLVVCGNATDLREMSSWDGKGPASRCKLIHQLQGNCMRDGTCVCV